MKANIWKCYVVKFLRMAHIFGGVMIPFFLDWGNLNFTKIFLLQSWFMFWIFILEIPTGYVADKFGRKTSIALGMLFLAGGSLVFGTLNSYAFFLLAEFFFSVGIALLSGADTALYYDTLKEIGLEKESRKYLARYEAVGTLGIVTGLPVGSLLAGSGLLPYPNSLPLTFIANAIISLVGFFVALTIIEPPRMKIRENFLEAGINGVKYVLTHSSLRSYALNATLVNSATFFIFWLYQPLAGRSGVDILYYGFIGAAFNILGAVLLLNVKKIERYFKLRNILIFTAVVPALLYFSLAFLKHWSLVLLAVVLLGGFKLFRKPILVDFMNKHIESENRATVLSGVSMLERLIMLSLYPFVGWLTDQSMNLTLIVLGSITLLFAIMARVKASTIAATTEGASS